MIIGGAAATFPGTVTGLRWVTYGYDTNVAAGIIKIPYAVVKVRDGAAVGTPTVDTPAGGAIYQPEVDVIAFGFLPISQASDSLVNPIEGSTKSMRKLNRGDAIYVVTGALTATQFISVQAQMFYKT